MPRLNTEVHAANSSRFGTKSPPAQKGLPSLSERKLLLAKLTQSGVSEEDRRTYFVELAKRIPEKSLRRICENLQTLGEDAAWLHRIFSLELQSFAPETPKPSPQRPAEVEKRPPVVKKAVPNVVGITDGKVAIKRAKQHFQLTGRPQWPTPETTFGEEEPGRKPGVLVHRAQPGRY